MFDLGRTLKGQEEIKPLDLGDLVSPRASPDFRGATSQFARLRWLGPHPHGDGQPKTCLLRYFITQL